MWNREELGQGILEIFCEAQTYADNTPCLLFDTIAQRDIELADKRSTESWRRKTATKQERTKTRAVETAYRKRRKQTDPVFLAKVRARSKEAMRKARLDPAKRAAGNAWQRAYRAAKKAKAAHVG